LQLVFSGNLRDPRPHFFELWITAPLAAIRLTEKGLMSELPRLALEGPDY
jgi:hypothetical protein